MSDKKRVYLFREGNATMRDLLGGKGANLAEMTNIGLPVPPGFNHYHRDVQRVYQAWQAAGWVVGGSSRGTGRCRKRHGQEARRCRQNPLLVSVSSGAKFSMPGMMDTVLNLGLNDDTLKGISRRDRQRALRLRRLPAISDDVLATLCFPANIRSWQAQFRDIFDQPKAKKGAKRRHRGGCRGPQRAVRRSTKHTSRK